MDASKSSNKIQAIPYASINWIRFGGFITVIIGKVSGITPPLGNNIKCYLLIIA